MFTTLRKILPWGGGKFPSLSGKISSKLNKIRKSHDGTIFIEFAFAVPVFMGLLYYIHDLPKLQRYHRHMQFVSRQMVQMIQTVSQNEKNRKITQAQINDIMTAAHATIFRGGELVPSIPKKMVTGYCPVTWIYYVEGVSDSTASVTWKLWTRVWVGKADVYIESRDRGATSVRCLSNQAPSKIYPGLEIKNKEAKMILESTLYYFMTPNGYFADGTLVCKVSPRKIFGFLCITPKFQGQDADKNGTTFFNGVTIFRPKPGLFDRTPPK